MLKTDFPDTAAIVRRLRRFEEHFVASFVDRFASLPVRVQLASVAVAIRHVPEVVLGSTIVVSLQQYLRMSASSLAAEIESRRDYVIIIPEELFREAQAARSQMAGQRYGWNHFFFQNRMSSRTTYYCSLFHLNDGVDEGWRMKYKECYFSKSLTWRYFSVFRCWILIRFKLPGFSCNLMKLKGPEIPDMQQFRHSTHRRLARGRLLNRELQFR